MDKGVHGIKKVENHWLRWE